MNEVVKVSIPRDFKMLLKERSEKLGITVPEYLRTLAYLDMTLQNYQELALCVNVLYNQIVDYHKTLDIHCAPIQEVPIVKLDEVC